MKTPVFSLAFFLLALTETIHAQVVDEYSWSKRHGNLNYTSPAKDQIIQGPCTIYASVGLVEAMYKLYFNAPNSIIDLSEEQVYSTCALDNQTDPSIEKALYFIKNSGIVDNFCVQENPETAFPSFSTNITNCAYPCNDNSREKVWIPKYSRITFSSEVHMKQTIISSGPIAVYCRPASLHSGAFHAYLIIGWKKISGITNWEVLDSWPSLSVRKYYTPENFYHLSVVDPNYFMAYKVYAVDSSTGQKITSTKRTAVSFTDVDRDGYYYWGIGPKPSGCPGYSQADGDDSNCRLGPMDINGYISKIVPIANNITIEAPGNPNSLCPDYDYTINANVCGADEYEMQVIGNATKYGSGANGTIWIHTSDDFGRVEIRVRARNAAGWSDYKSRFYYRNSYCPVSLSNKMGEDTTNIMPENTIIKTDLSVYPIPVRDIIYIQPAESELIKKIILYNQLGSQVKFINSEGIDGIIEINVSDLPSGLYYMRIFGVEKYTDKKVLITND